MSLVNGRMNYVHLGLVLVLIGVIGGVIGLATQEEATPVAEQEAVQFNAGSLGRLQPTESAFRHVAAGSKAEVVSRITLAEGGKRLRVGAQSPLLRNPAAVALSLTDPSGHVVTGGNDLLSTELVVPNPRAGDWVIRVLREPSETPVRLRARLEDENNLRTKNQLPNLQAVPPFDFKRHLPGHGREKSCWPYERRVWKVDRCLRFSFGIANVGDDAFTIQRGASKVRRDGRLPIRQALPSGVILAGVAELHRVHAHLRIEGLVKIELFRREDGALVSAARSRKLGFCLDDLTFATWRRFAGEGRRAPSGGCDASTRTVMGLSAGWLEIYSWEILENFVEAPAPKGIYVLRVSVDAKDLFRESDNSDNVGYSVVRIGGTGVRLLERGVGYGPLDPAKRVTRGPWN